MKKYIIPTLIAVLLISLVGFIYFNNNSLQVGKQYDFSNTYEATKVSTENESQDNTTIEIPIPAITEQEFATFNTKVYGTAARKNNISICTSLLNDTTVPAGEIFSFWNTVGNTTAEKGYQKAKSFDEHGNTIQTYGGGVCQVSTTLYNAVLVSPELEVVERHPHSKQVTYVPKDKDASVAYSASDFKFKNNTSSAIKIYANYEGDTLTVRLVKLPNV